VTKRKCWLSVTETSGERCDKKSYFFLVLSLLWMIREVETPLASITEIPFFVSEDSRGLCVLSFFKPVKEDGQQSPLKCFHFRRPKTSRNQLKLAKPWVEDNKELKKHFFSFGSSYTQQAAVLSRLWSNRISSTQPCLPEACSKGPIHSKLNCGV